MERIRINSRKDYKETRQEIVKQFGVPGRARRLGYAVVEQVINCKDDASKRLLLGKSR